MSASPAASPRKPSRLIPRLFLFTTLLLGAFTMFLRVTARSPMIAPPLTAIHEFGPDPIGFEISNNPAVLFNRGESVQSLTLHGVRLGTDRFLVPAHLLKDGSNSRQQAELRLVDDNAFYVANGRVWRIVLRNREHLSRLSIKDELQLMSSRCFGDPEQVSYTTSGRPYTLYSYSSRGITIRWDRMGDRIDQITITNPSSITMYRSR